MGHQTGAVSMPVYIFHKFVSGFGGYRPHFALSNVYSLQIHQQYFAVPSYTQEWSTPNWNILKTNQTTTSPFASHKWIASVRHLAKLLTLFHAQEELLNSSSWVDQVPNSRKEICQSNYRNDDQKYDLNILGNINHL